MNDTSNINREPMLEMFIFETNQLLEQLEELLLLAEKNSHIGTESINEIFRIMHTIKGSSSMMMFNNISSVSHSVEDLFYFIRENKPAQLDYSAICDLVLSASDYIKGEISKIESGSQSDGQEKELVERIKKVLSTLRENFGEAANHHESAQQDHDNRKFYISTYPNKQIEECQRYIAKVYFEEDCQMENIRAFTIIHNLKEISSEIYHRPADIIGDNTSAQYIVKNGFDIYFSTNAKNDDVEKLFSRALFVRDFNLTAVDSYTEEISDLPGRDLSEDIHGDKDKEDGHKPQEVEKDNETASKNPKQNLISVNITKLDKLMDLVGEIVITESMVTSNPDLAGLQLDNFSKAARQLRKLNDELQDVVMSIRMIPIAATFHKMQRIVRDMGRKLDKEAELVILGEETEVDKNIIDNLSDPLMHLIRNAMDHGIENSEERKKKGKPVTGKITLEARNTGGDVTISITDDGKGLNKEKIIKKARVNGLINKPEADLTDREIFSYILLPGFSTKEQVTEFSGRGVGMDVVGKNIEKVGGTVIVESIAGEGTTISIKIPLTLAIIDGMEIAVGNSIFTLPIVSIKESFRPAENDLITDPDGNEMLMIRGKCCPVIRLHNLFKVQSGKTELPEGIIVVIENDTRTVCLFADQLLGERQVVVKPLPQFFSKYRIKGSGVGGCTILGDGSISLILDTQEIINNKV